MEQNEEPIVISEREFDVYEMIRMSGATNMFDAKRVESLSKVIFSTTLDRPKIINIMKYYQKYADKWLTKEKFRLLKAELNSTDLQPEETGGYDYDNAANIQEFH